MKLSFLSNWLRCSIVFAFIFVLNIFGQGKELAGIDTYINEVCKKFEVPGISVAVVKDGKIVLAKGYGIKRLNGSDPVDENTLFGIASNSKAFTATALALLVEEGKIKWDAPVKEYLPWFQMPEH